MKNTLFFKFKSPKNPHEPFVYLGFLFCLFIGLNSCTPLPPYGCKDFECRDERRYDQRNRRYRSGPLPGREYPEEALEYFLEIGFGAEHFNVLVRPIVKKWRKDIRIKLYGNHTREDEREIDKIADELSDLTGLNIRREDTKSNVNVYFVDPDKGENQDTWSRFIPNLRGLAFPLNNIKNCIIYGAKIWIDRTTKGEARKSVLREELTQILGLLKDSYAHPNSIFHHTDSPVEFAEVDREVIRILYDERVEPCMTKLEVRRVLGYQKSFVLVYINPFFG